MEHSWAPLVLLIGLWLTYCAFVFICLMQLLGFMLRMKKMFHDFLIGKCELILYVIYAYTIHDLYFVIVVEAFITLKSLV